MVQLVVHESGQICMLEVALINKNVKYEVVEDIDLEYNYGLATPFLLVNGAPLDEYHAFKLLESIDLVDIVQKRYPYLC